MKRSSSTIAACTVLALSTVIPGRGAAASPADEAFEQLAAAYISELPRFSPVNATAMGDHSADHLIDQVNASERKRLRERYADYRSRLAEIDREALSRPNRIDAAILGNEVGYRLFALKDLQEWAWNPLVYVDISGSAIYGLLARDFSPLDERLDDVAARLEQMPRFLRQARGSLVPARVPKIHAETAVQQNRGLLTIIGQQVEPHVDALPPAARDRLRAAIETARSAITAHQAWLETELLPKAAGEFRLGAELYDRKLAFTLESTLSRREIRRLAEAEYLAVRAAMYEVAKGVYARQHPYTAFPDNPDEAYKQVIIRAALELAYRRRPEPDAIVDTAKEYLAQAGEFVVERDIVSMPEEPVEIILMPEFQRGVAIAYLDPPGPLDEGQKAFYAVAPLPGDWTPEQVRSFLREYNLYSMHSLTMHEGVPGHYLQFAFSNRHPSVLRSVLWSGPFVEGWAVYVERVMVDAGYLDDDPLMRLVSLKWYLRAVTNAIIDSAIHVDGMTRDQAMRLMIEGGFQEESEAAGKWVRAQLTSTQLSTYFVGYQEHAAMRKAVEAAWGGEFTLRRYHDQALSYGSPPVKYVRALMLNEDIPAAAGRSVP